MPLGLCTLHSCTSKLLFISPFLFLTSLYSSFSACLFSQQIFIKCLLCERYCFEIPQMPFPLWEIPSPILHADAKVCFSVQPQHPVNLQPKPSIPSPLNCGQLFTPSLSRTNSWEQEIGFIPLCIYSTTFYVKFIYLLTLHLYLKIILIFVSFLLIPDRYQWYTDGSPCPLL